MARTKAARRSSGGKAPRKSLGGKSTRSMRKAHPATKSKKGKKGKGKAEASKPAVYKTSAWVSHRRRAARLRKRQEKHPTPFCHMAGIIRVAQDVASEVYDRARYSRGVIDGVRGHVESIIRRLILNGKRRMLRAGRITLTEDDIIDEMMSLKMHSRLRGYHAIKEASLLEAIATVVKDKEEDAARARALRAAILKEAEDAASDTDDMSDVSDEEDGSDKEDDVLDEEDEVSSDDILED